MNVDGWTLIFERFGLVLPVVAVKTPNLVSDWRVVSDPSLVALLFELRRLNEPPPKGVEVQDSDWFIPVWVVDGNADLLSIILSGGVDRVLLTRYRDPFLVDMLISLAESSLDNIVMAGMTPDDFGEILDLLSTGSLADEPKSAPLSVAPISGNTWGIPSLDLALQADKLLLPFVKWGTVSRSIPIDGTFHFYTSDRKFSGLAAEPDRLSRLCRMAVEINFTTEKEMPRVLALHTIYRKRYAARRWQRAGVRVWVDLNVDRAFDDLALLGVPLGWQSYANRGYSTDLKHLTEAFERARDHANGRDVHYLVYGGGAGARRLCESHGWIWAQEDAARARRGDDGA